MKYGAAKACAVSERGWLPVIPLCTSGVGAPIGRCRGDKMKERGIWTRWCGWHRVQSRGSGAAATGGGYHTGRCGGRCGRGLGLRPGWGGARSKQGAGERTGESGRGGGEE